MNELYPPLVVGGAEKSVSLLAEALVRTGDQVTVVCLHDGENTQVEDRNGVRVYRVPLKNIYWPIGRAESPGRVERLIWHLLDMWNWRTVREVGRILDLERPDVVHTNTIAGFSVAVFRQVKRRRIRLVHTLRDYYMLCARYTLFCDGKICEDRCRDCKLLSLNRSMLSRQVDAVVANSEYVLRTHQRHGWFAGVPGQVIFNIAESSAPADGVDETIAGVASERPVESARVSATAAEDQGLVFGFIGKLDAQKGIEVLLGATALLMRPNWRLRIAGKGWESYVSRLKFRFPDPRIEWLGFAEPSAFYQSIDVSMIASIWAEPLPRTLIETFAAGKSAICARSGGILEIASLGKVVETYQADDPQALAGLMDDAIGDPQRWRDGGWKDSAAPTLFSETTISRQYRDVYRGVSAADARPAPEPARYPEPIVVIDSVSVGAGNTRV